MTLPDDEMRVDLETLKREAKRLKRAYEGGDRQAALQVRQWLGHRRNLRHADFLHATARARGFESWPKLKVAVEVQGLTRAAAQQRLSRALFYGQKVWIDRLMADHTDLVDGELGLACATYNVAAVKDALSNDADVAVLKIGSRTPLLHLCFSRYGALGLGAPDDALSIARLLLDAGADPNEAFAPDPGADDRSPALYGAISHAQNTALVELLLKAGADPNDNESLYHATEQSDLSALELLIANGAEPAGTNAHFRAMDFDHVRAVEMLLDAGADPNDGISGHPSGPADIGRSALHHAAERLCGAPMFELLVARGAKLDVQRNGLGAYAAAKLFGNEDGARALARLGAPTDMPDAVSALLNGQGPINPDKLPNEARGLATSLAGQVGTLDRLKAFIAVGLEWDRPDRTGLTPVQVAGWVGLAEHVAYFLGLKPDLSHVNGYGGTLLSTIIHGSENSALGEAADHVACLELVLREGVALPQQAIQASGREDVVAFLEEWAEKYPGQVVEHGVS